MKTNSHGFVLAWDKCEGTYAPSGELLYGHYIRKGRYILVHPSHCNVLAYLRRQGAMQMREGSPLRRRVIDGINQCRAQTGQALLSDAELELPA